MTDFTIKIPEITRTKVCWETCKGGIETEMIYVVTDEDYSRETESFVGYLYNDRMAGFGGSFDYPYKFVFDGLLYAHRIKEEDVIEVIGDAEHKRHKERMKAIEALLAPKPVEQFTSMEAI